MKRLLTALAAVTTLSACATPLLPPPRVDGVDLELGSAPITSADDSFTVRVSVREGDVRIAGARVRVETQFTDSAGDPGAIDDVEVKTGLDGWADAAIDKLETKGDGTVIALAIDDDGDPIVRDGIAVEASVPFEVLDGVVPLVTLGALPGAPLGRGMPLDIAVEAADESGLAEIVVRVEGAIAFERILDVSGLGGTFTVAEEIPEDAAGGEVTVTVEATDESGNSSAPSAGGFTIDTSATLSLPPGATMEVLTEGTAEYLADPTAMAVSPLDGNLYIADHSPGLACQDHCIRKVDPATGDPLDSLGLQSAGRVLSLSFNVDGMEMYFVEQPRAVKRSAFSLGSYGGASRCDDALAATPAAPTAALAHPTVGLLVTDTAAGIVYRAASCGAAFAPFTGAVFQVPSGIAAATDGAMLVSDAAQGTLVRVEAGGTTSPFADGLVLPRIASIDANGTAWVLGDRRITTRDAAAQPATALTFAESPIAMTWNGDVLLVLLPKEGGGARLVAIDGL